MARRLASLTFLILLAFPLSAVAEPRQVLLLHSFEREFAPFDAFVGNFRAELTQNSSVPVNFYDVSLQLRATEVPDEGLIELYAEALAVIYTPFDEDFGYVTLEAFLSRKPVITATDSGGPLEFVVDGVNGSIIAPQPESLADAINRYAADRRRAASHGDAGHVRASLVTWDGVIEKLVR